MAYLATFYSAVEAKVGAIWTDVLPANSGGGVIRSEVLERLVFDDQTLPYATIHMPDFVEEDWGMANAVFRCNVEIYRVQAGPEDITTLLTKLEAMRAGFLANDLTYGQVISPGMSISWSPYVSAVAMVLQKQLQCCVGRLVVPCLVGEGY